ncbi:MAG: nicotinate phosphoribosyltransferase [Thermanaerothrix sp.]|nr:nicotinate phosphoribosyltransferase [Thermanaerothrix sp.]
MSSGVDRMEDVFRFEVEGDRLFSADHHEIVGGWTSDVYFVKTRDVLRSLGRLDVEVCAEVFAREGGVFCGVEEVRRLFLKAGARVSVEALEEGEEFYPREVVMRIRGPYGEFGLYETTLLGMLSSASGWATAARRCVEAAGGLPVLCFGARHVHPSCAPVMERSALIGGCSDVSCILGAKLGGREPRGTIPHAAVLIAGDTVKVALAYDKVLPEQEKRSILVDTFRDEAEEALSVAEALKERLFAVRLDTPGERGGVTPDLVREVRCRLSMAGYGHVGVFVSGGLNPERIRVLAEAGASGFGVGSYIAHGTPRDMTMDIKEVDGVSVAKRGRIPGVTPNPRLKRVI